MVLQAWFKSWSLKVTAELGTGSDFGFCLRKTIAIKVESQTSPQVTFNPDLNQAALQQF